MIIKNKNKKNLTIDLKAIIAKDYLYSKKTNMNKLTETFIKYIAICGIIWFIIVSLVGWGVLHPVKKVNASQVQNLSFLAHFPETKKVVIGCYNTYTAKTREATKCTKPGDKNIILPDQGQIKIWLQYFNESEIINRLALVNFESSFNENAKNPWAKGYIQTLRKWNISPKIAPQLAWLKNRQNHQKNPKICGRYWKVYNYKDNQPAGEYGVLACLYRFHYHAYKGVWYSKRGIITTKFYKKFMFWIK